MFHKGRGMIGASDQKKKKKKKNRKRNSLEC